MKSGGLKSQGFTIVEIMIFLAVSGAIMISALRMVSGAQNKNEFIVAVNDIEQQINGIINNVSTGYYANTGSFTKDYECKKDQSSGRPSFSAVSPPGSGKQGTSKDCIFIGRMIQFGVTGGAEDQYNVYNVAGIRQDSSGNQITSPAEARPIIIAPLSLASYPGMPNIPDTTAFPDATETGRLKNGITMRWSHYTQGATNYWWAGGIAFFSSLNGGSAATPDIKSGALQVDVMPLHDVWHFVSAEAAIKNFDNRDFTDANATYGYNATKNPSDGIELCFDSGGTEQSALITIGGSAGQSVVTKQIRSGKCSVQGAPTS